MDIIGRWNVKKVFRMTHDGAVLCTPDELPSGEDYDEMRAMAQCAYEFLPDGTVYTLPAPALASELGMEDAE